MYHETARFLLSEITVGKTQQEQLQCIQALHLMQGILIDLQMKCVL